MRCGAVAALPLFFLLILLFVNSVQACWRSPPPKECQYSDWTPTDRCSDSCGMCGFVPETRQLLKGDQDKCNEPVERNSTSPCGTRICLIPRPSCCQPFRAAFVNRTLSCVSPTVDDFKWSEWSNLKSCAHPDCGSCSQRVQRRVCLRGNCTGPSEQRMDCSAQACVHPLPACCAGFELYMPPGGGRLVCKRTFPNSSNVTRLKPFFPKASAQTQLQVEPQAL